MKFLDTKRPPARLVVAASGVRIYEGKAEDWRGDEPIDLVFTNPYGPLPWSLVTVPVIVHQWRHRFDELVAWTRRPDLECFATWNDDREAFYASGLRMPLLDLSTYRPEPGGWYPLDMAHRILASVPVSRWPMTVWDGFMGRGTVGKVARALGMRYIGVEELPGHIDLACEYLGVERTA